MASATTINRKKRRRPTDRTGWSRGVAEHEVAVRRMAAGDSGFTTTNDWRRKRISHAAALAARMTAAAQSGVATTGVPSGCGALRVEDGGEGGDREGKA